VGRAHYGSPLLSTRSLRRLAAASALVIGAVLSACTADATSTDRAEAAGTSVVSGPAGPTGPVGARGATGETGAAGATGAHGHTGAAGQQGARGEPGPQGPAGLGDLGCTDGQTVVWQASTSSWQCTNTVANPLSQLSCTLDQSIRWNGTAWACVDTTKVFSLGRSTTWQRFNGSTVAAVFPLRSAGVDGGSTCSTFSYCTITFTNVSDHRTCTFTEAGSQRPMNSAVFSISNIQFFDLDYPFEFAISMSLTFFCA